MNRGTKSLGLWAVIALCLTALSARAENRILVNGKEMPAYREGEVIVKYKDGAIRTMEAMDGSYRRIGVQDVKRFHGALKSFEHLVFDSSQVTVEKAVDELKQDPSVEYVQPNYMMYALAGEQAGQLAEDKGGQALARPRIAPRPADGPYVADPSVGYTWGMSKIGATQAWGRQRGSRNVVVAVIDSGIDYNHPDLAANIWRNPWAGRLEATGVDAEGKGYTDLVGWDFVHNDALPYDDNNHGTHVAGTIGAVGGNGRGVSGVAQRVSVMAVKFLDSSGSGDTAAALKGIDYAISRGAKVLNNSWGGGGYNPALRDAVRRAANAGALFIAAAGNDGTNNDVSPAYPASFNVPNVISVAATTSRDGLASFSNFGARSVHLGAPGEGIYSTAPGGRYMTMSGTSMATPHVAGAAALIWAQFPNASAQEIKRRLINSGDYLPALQGRTISGRRLNVLRALQ